MITVLGQGEIYWTAGHLVIGRQNLFVENRNEAFIIQSGTTCGTANIGVSVDTVCSQRRTCPSCNGKSG